MHFSEPIITSHSGLYKARTCPIANPNKRPGPYPVATAFQLNTSSSSSSSSCFSCCVGGALEAKQVSWRGRPQSPAFPAKEDIGCPLICVPFGISPMSWL
ncbi:unnamed protein product [Arabidopsis halleri]